MSSGDLQATCKAAVMALSQHARSVRRECTPNFSKLWQQARDAKSFVYIPYVPMLWRPGWLLRYIFGPFDNVWFSGVYGDLVAGITVAMTLIPQGLSYSALAGLSPVNGWVGAYVC
jgi:MFS superfamily sulfate permease-like transporter